MENRDFIAKIDITKHPEFKNAECRYQDCEFKGESFEKLVDHIHSVHVSQEGSNGPKVSWLISDLIPKKPKNSNFGKILLPCF